MVSVIVPIYNVEKYIARCARTVFAQTYENLEIIFVDDCTPDRSIEILETVLTEFPKRAMQTQVICHEKNQGSAAVRLDGLIHSTGYYTIQFDSDDWVEQDMVESLVIEAERKQADITICDYNIVLHDKTVYKKVDPPLEPIACMKEVLVERIHSAFWNKLIRRSLYFDNAILPTSGLDMWEDMSVMYKLMYCAKKLAYVARPLYNYNQDNLASYSNGGVISTEQKRRCAMQIVKQMNDFVVQTEGLPYDVKRALTHYKITRLAAMLLGQREIDRYDRDLIGTITVGSVLSHPTLKWPRKLACLLFLFHCPFLLSLLCRAFQLRHSR